MIMVSFCGTITQEMPPTFTLDHQEMPPTFILYEVERSTLLYEVRAIGVFDTRTACKYEYIPYVSIYRTWYVCMSFDEFFDLTAALRGLFIYSCTYRYEVVSCFFLRCSYFRSLLLRLFERTNVLVLHTGVLVSFWVSCERFFTMLFA